ncbi:molybdenum cofactor guanylyltransferase [Thermaerobacillus caldiproteolyticus]|uniref:Probable molybdenum cofactor guanylyltransferase n=1 Tax=Thermaerobacillus caldiproteolyticus TaxID=247480 RepID=A0A7W0C070_9BACL|nr:molybdenum cofactor guanylyltransferase [Anoxybacillus caldiproteolyticus]MBA2874899.1 molybdopterin-guanine dinucleotide biosynthesis protein A [Anoxybacillus caldiproteolyticus]QPA31700.1 molybdenum cofactor guanylyltransferase [Anoxybacillus caldiproteolyticus]
MEQMVGAVLAGGESRRFGSPKAFAKREGMYFFQIAINALRPFVEDIYIVSHPSLLLRFQQLTDEKIIMDEEVYRGQGPLAGIYTVMKNTKAEWVFVLPCDMPYMRTNTVANMIRYVDETFDAILSAHFGRIQPLVGMYHRRTLERMEQLLEAGENRMMSLLNRCRVRYVNEHDFIEEEGVFRNVNERDEYDDIVT